ncbi:hypothetical protein [Nocardia asteroides]|uniref:hypothetical protein n=1 Tax=Nocardia asteroides TaxID=1824 RepID=UPI001E5B0D19|nr:hypothetical protein [Nocardia asteroides]UGT61308.1 hypothetical protein LTT61_29965 [Nocardia asteroides]
MSTEPTAGQPDRPRAEPTARRDAEPAARRGAAPRSTLWRVALGTTPVVATALTLEFGRTLVVDSFGETEVVQTLASTLRAFWVLLVVGGVLFAGYRWYSRRQDEERLTRTRALLDTLNKPHVEVVGIPPRPATFTPPADSARNPTEAAVLRLLPVRRYDSATLLAVATALVDAEKAVREPGTEPPGFETATELCEQLLADRVVAVQGARYYYPTVGPSASERDAVLGNPAWQAALTALVREHADRASARAVALGHPGHAAAARRWFGASTRDLRTLLNSCAAASMHKHLPTAVLPELVRILDALEVQDAGELGFALLCSRVATIPDLAKLFPMQHGLLELRANQAADDRRRYRPLSWSTGVAARSSHRRALRHLRTRTGLDEAVTELEQTWRLLPRADLPAEVCVLINLAVAELRRGRLEAAADRLELAFTRTENGRDPGGRVHATEISGVLRWMCGDSDAALEHWLSAYTGYMALDEARGAGRCLRHLSEVLDESPELGGVAIEPTSASGLGIADVEGVVASWRTDANRLDRDGSAATLSDRRPREVDHDQHLHISRQRSDGS